MLIGAHRGDPARAPENTIPSFLSALENGAELIEFDVQLTRDRVPVVIHDEWVDRTSNGHGRVCELTLKELKRFDFGGYKGERWKGTQIPTLREALDVIGPPCLINIEIKNGPVYYDGIEELVWEDVEATGCQERIIVSSFDHRSIERIKQMVPFVKVAFLIAHRPLAISYLKPNFELYAFHPHYAYIDRDLVVECQQMGFKVNAWGTNDPNEWNRLLGIGVDCVITDYVQELSAFVRYRQGELGHGEG